jgi:hypothetical protein
MNERILFSPVPLTVILLLNIPFVYFVPEDVNGG